MFEGFRTGLPGGEHEELDLFGLDEVVRLIDDQLQATARPFSLPDCTSAGALAFDKGPFFQPVEEHGKALEEDVK